MTPTSKLPPPTPPAPALAPDPARVWVDKVRATLVSFDKFLDFGTVPDRLPPDKALSAVLDVFHLLGATPGYVPILLGEISHDARAVSSLIGRAEQMARRARETLPVFFDTLAFAVERAIEAGGRHPGIVCAEDFNGHLDRYSRGELDPWRRPEDTRPLVWLYGAINALPDEHPLRSLSDNDTVEDPRLQGRGLAGGSRWLCLGNPGSDDKPRPYYIVSEVLRLTQIERRKELAILQREQEEKARLARLQAEASRVATQGDQAALAAEVARLRAELAELRQATPATAD
jgi:hypothetical protein